jgi:hypothetical protein
MVKANVRIGSLANQPVKDLPAGTLVKWHEVKWHDHVCLVIWVDLVELKGQLYWSKETIEQLKMTVDVLPKDTVVEITQQ